MTKEFELKLASGKIVIWDGETGEDAAKRYAMSHNETIIAWRDYPRTGIFYADIRKVTP